MGHRSSKQLEEAPSQAIISQTVHSNNLSILNVKMKIFFVIALAMYFPRSVVLDVDCSDNSITVPDISTDCLDEFNNAVTNGNIADFYTRCASTTDTLSARCSLCCTTDCSTFGLENTAQDLDGDSKDFTYVDDIASCKAACDNVSGCTAFEFNHAGEEDVSGKSKCGTYTGGASDLMTSNSWNQTKGYQKATWTSCII